MDLTSAEWCTSSYTSSNGGNCVEVARNLPGGVAVRDSKDREGPVLVLPRAAWQAFTAGIAAGELAG
jgi:hypothetical protein